MVLLSFSQTLMESQRQWVVSELEQLFKQYGNFIQKTSLEIESQLFDKARNSEEYAALARRLLRHMLDVAKQRQRKPHSPTRPEPAMRLFREETGPNPFRVGLAPPPPGKDPQRSFSAPPAAPLPDSLSSPSTTTAPVSFPSPTTKTDVNSGGQPPVKPACPILTPVTMVRNLLTDMIYETVRLPAPNKRTLAAMTTSSRKRSPTSRPDDSARRTVEDTEIITRLLPSALHVADTELSHDTYEATYKFLVPRNSVIKQITLQLQKLS